MTNLILVTFEQIFIQFSKNLTLLSKWLLYDWDIKKQFLKFNHIVELAKLTNSQFLFC